MKRRHWDFGYEPVAVGYSRLEVAAPIDFVVATGSALDEATLRRVVASALARGSGDAGTGPELENRDAACPRPSLLDAGSGGRAGDRGGQRGPRVRSARRDRGGARRGRRPRPVRHVGPGRLDGGRAAARIYPGSRAPRPPTGPPRRRARSRPRRRTTGSGFSASRGEGCTSTAGSAAPARARASRSSTTTRPTWRSSTSIGACSSARPAPPRRAGTPP